MPTDVPDNVNEDGTFWLALAAAATQEKPPTRLTGLLLAPKMTTWPGDASAVIVDVPITPAK